MPVVRLVVNAQDAELAADALWGARPSAVHEEQLDDGQVVLTADVAEPDSPGLARWHPTVVTVDDAVVDTWQDFAEPWHAGTRFIVIPAWHADAASAFDDPTPDATAPATGPTPEHATIRLVIDPGRVFGSGSHPSSRQVLAAMEDVVSVGASVLDIGCGSGILAVAAARLGARGVLALDIDEAAVAVTAANAAHNGVAVRVEAATVHVEDVRSTFDVVLANIGVRVLCDLAPAIGARVAPGGHLVLAGLLDDQADTTRASYPDLAEVARVSEGGWTCLTLRRG